MDTPPDDLAALLQSAIDDHGFLSWLDVRVDSVDTESVTLRVPFNRDLCNEGPENRGEINGGVAATLIDTSGGLACRTAVSAARETGVATIDLNVSYLRSAVGDLTATAEVVRVGQSIGVAEVTVESDTPESGIAPVAVGRGSYRLFREES